MKNIYTFLLVFIIAIITTGCKKSDKTDIPSTLPSWAKQAVLYEVNTRQMTPEGTFNALRSHLPRIKSLGVDILWLMPIHPISVKNRKATNGELVENIEDLEERKKYLGSPYAVADYLKINSDMGTSDDFKEFVNDVHRRGMKVIIDWVPNHSGWDNPWISDHPDWYTTDSKGNIVDPINPETGESWGWTDVADLNYDNSEMRLAMLDALKYWILEYDIDGYRVDVAHGLPNDFIDQMRDELLSLEKPLFMLAESEVPYHRNSGAFHATYGWSFHHLLNDIAREEKDVRDIKKWVKQDRKKFRKGFNLQFTSNHDENAWAGTVFERMDKAHQAMAVVAATMDGMPLIYSGQEAPLYRRLSFFEKDSIDWGEYAYSDFYKRLFNFKEECSALRNGTGGEIEFITDSKKVLAFQRQKNNDKAIVLVNLTSKTQTYKLNISFENQVNILTGSMYDAQAGEEREIGPWKYYVLKS